MSAPVGNLQEMSVSYSFSVRAEELRWTALLTEIPQSSIPPARGFFSHKIKKQEDMTVREGGYTQSFTHKENEKSVTDEVSSGWSSVSWEGLYPQSIKLLKHFLYSIKLLFISILYIQKH